MGAGRWRRRALASGARAWTACHASPSAPSGVRTPRLIRTGPRRPGGLRRPVGHAPCSGGADHAALRHAPCDAVDTVSCRRCDAVGHASWFPTRELTAPGSPHPVPLSLGLHRTEPSCGCLVRSAASPSQSADELALPRLTTEHQPLQHRPTEPPRHPVHRLDWRHCVATGFGAEAGAPPPPSPLAIAEPLSNPSNHRNGTLGKPKQLPRTFPDQTRRRLAGFWSSTPAMAPGGHIASISVFPGSFP
jgi:hypothetical protein